MGKWRRFLARLIQAAVEIRVVCGFPRTRHLSIEPIYRTPESYLRKSRVWGSAPRLCTYFAAACFHNA